MNTAQIKQLAADLVKEVLDDMMVADLHDYTDDLDLTDDLTDDEFEALGHALQTIKRNL